MATISTDDAASCETYCSSVGDIQQGSVAWTYYTDGSNSCECWLYFNSSEGPEYSNTDAVSGRFVDEGAPTTDNCGEKCDANGNYDYVSNGDSLEDCQAACEGYDWSLGMLYWVKSSECACISEVYGGGSWYAELISVIY